MKLTINKTFIALALSLIVFAIGCKGPATNNGNIIPPLTASTSVKGYNLLSKICGIWAGPVASSTPIGSFPDWIVDFRPISASQVSAKNELDTVNSIFMSFFIVYDSSQYKLAFRNGGTFSGNVRVSYMGCDSVVETASYSYYRFIDFIKGTKRTITEVTFHSDSIHIRSYTSVNNTLPAATQWHMDWQAGLQDTTSCQAAKIAFSYPQKTLVKNFSNAFTGDVQSMFYTYNGDPYPQSAQPYLGQSTLSYTVSPLLPAGDTIPTGAKVYLIVTVQPLISGGTVSTLGLNTRSRYVILPSPDASYIFNYMHPGSYYLYAFYDANGNGIPDTGDYISTANTAFTLSPLGTASATAQINYMIP
jgi:hypothetical protein